jgi:hypothetical protein
MVIADIRVTSIRVVQKMYIRNRTRRVEKLQPKLPSMLRSQFRVLRMAAAPRIAVGPQCSRHVTCDEALPATWIERLENADFGGFTNPQPMKQGTFE